MKRAKTLSTLVLAIAYLFFGTGFVYADTKPYFRTLGADTFVGGWFNSGASSCSPSAATFQAPKYSSLSDLFKGGIMTFANSNGTGSGSQFGALALGLIEGNGTSSYGFTSGSSGYNKLSFANSLPASMSVTNYWGGLWEGSDAHQATHCLPDYFGTKQSSPQALAGRSLPSLASGQYSAGSAGTVTTISSGAVTIDGGKQVSLFITGNAYINGNITYGAHNADNVPKFALVVSGDIYIDSSVTQLDGLFIAQPYSNGASGVIWTCHDGTTDVPKDSYLRSNCSSKLTINGSLIAKQVAFLRIGGDLSGDSAEVINYTPEMVIGGGFFSTTAASNYKIESLISLPPVF